MKILFLLGSLQAGRLEKISKYWSKARAVLSWQWWRLLPTPLSLSHSFVPSSSLERASLVFGSFQAIVALVLAIFPHFVYRKRKGDKSIKEHGEGARNKKVSNLDTNYLLNIVFWRQTREHRAGMAETMYCQLQGGGQRFNITTSRKTKINSYAHCIALLLFNLAHHQLIRK